MKGYDCEDCGKENKRGGRWCATCYGRRYRHDPTRGDERRARHRSAVRDYIQRVPEKRTRWVHAYRSRVGSYVPELQDLRRAIKAVDQAVQAAEKRAGVRESGKHG